MSSFSPPEPWSSMPVRLRLPQADPMGSRLRLARSLWASELNFAMRSAQHSLLEIVAWAAIGLQSLGRCCRPTASGNRISRPPRRQKAPRDKQRSASCCWIFQESACPQIELHAKRCGSRRSWHHLGCQKPHANFLLAFLPVRGIPQAWCGRRQLTRLSRELPHRHAARSWSAAQPSGFRDRSQKALRCSPPKLRFPREDRLFWHLDRGNFNFRNFQGRRDGRLPHWNCWPRQETRCAGFNRSGRGGCRLHVFLRANPYKWRLLFVDWRFRRRRNVRRLRYGSYKYWCRRGRRRRHKSRRRQRRHMARACDWRGRNHWNDRRNDRRSDLRHSLYRRWWWRRNNRRLLRRNDRLRRLKNCGLLYWRRSRWRGRHRN